METNLVVLTESLVFFGFKFTSSCFHVLEGKKGVPSHYCQVLKILYWKLESCFAIWGLLLRGQEFNCQFLKINSSVKCQSFLCIAWLNWALPDYTYICIYSSWIILHDSNFVSQSMIQRKSKELATIDVTVIDEKNNHSLINHSTELRLTPKYFSI